MSESQWVEIVHPDLPPESQSPGGGRAVVSREAFDEVWAERGWIVAEPEAAPPVEPPPNPEQPAYATVSTGAADETADEPDAGAVPDEPEPTTEPKSKTTTKKGK